ncbi:MAG TPA: hypothetical protein VMH27_20645 [Puia sp.]|nr:hypothetical protein [Puia sp.]
MEQNKQGAQPSETQQTKKPENANQNQQANPQNQQGASQNHYAGSQEQQPSSKEKAYGSSGSAYGSQHNEEGRDENRQQGREQGPVTAQRNQPGMDTDEEKANSDDMESQSGTAQRSGTPGQDKGNIQGQQKSGNNPGNKGGQR